MELIMSKASRSALIALTAGVLSLAAFGAVVFTPTAADAAAWCAYVGGGARNCGFYTRRECRQSYRSCYRNPRR